MWAKRRPTSFRRKRRSSSRKRARIKPLDAPLLTTLKWLYNELQDWEMLAGVVDDQVQGEQNAAKKLELVMTLAELYHDKIADPIRAADVLEVALDLDRKRLDVFEGLVRSLTEAKDWDRLERSYRRMIARVKDDDEPQADVSCVFPSAQALHLPRLRLGDASRGSSTRSTPPRASSRRTARSARS